jgi:hypothetical protein
LPTVHAVTGALRLSLLALIIRTVCIGGPDTSPIEAWQRFEVSVRDRTISGDSALAQFPGIFAALDSIAGTGHTRSPVDRARWTFPVRGGFGMELDCRPDGESKSTIFLRS